MKKLRILISMVILTLLTALFVLPQASLAQAPEINWVAGPVTVDLGDNLAQIDLDKAYIFADGEDTRAIMASLGNPPSHQEVGMIVPKAEGANWFIIFEFDPIGYVRDDEKDNIDAAAILQSVQSGTEEANKIRVKNGFPPLTVIGWHEAPHYEETSHNLAWTLLAEEGGDGRQVVNYNVRLLGRTGYMSVVLVTDPATLDTVKPEVEKILAGFSYKPGKRYAEYIAGDKVATYGLTALIAGGAGAAATKAGFFKSIAKFGKLIFLAIVAFFGAMSRALKGFFGRSNKPQLP
jgi:uncharacterized membrane-anchored protein